jgi:hypothetical protein
VTTVRTGRRGKFHPKTLLTRLLQQLVPHGTYVLSVTDREVLWIRAVGHNVEVSDDLALRLTKEE